MILGIDRYRSYLNLLFHRCRQEAPSPLQERSSLPRGTFGVREHCRGPYSMIDITSRSVLYGNGSTGEKWSWIRLRREGIPKIFNV